MEKKICLYTSPFPGVKSYKEIIDYACEYGVYAVEGFCMLEFAEPDRDAAKEIREYADSKGVVFPCFSVYANPAGDDSKNQTERLKGFADVAKILGSPYLHHTIASECSNPDNAVPYREKLFETGINAVREVYDYCESIGIKAIYEDQGYIFNGVKGFGEFLDKVDRNVGVVSDFGNIYQSGESIDGFIKAFSDRFSHAHIKDVRITDTNESGKGLITLDGRYMHEAIIGEGDVDIAATVDLMKKSGYTGYYGIEYGAKEDGSQDMAKAVELIKSLL